MSRRADVVITANGSRRSRAQGLCAPSHSQPSTGVERSRPVRSTRTTRAGPSATTTTTATRYREACCTSTRVRPMSNNAEVGWDIPPDKKLQERSRVHLFPFPPVHAGSPTSRAFTIMVKTAPTNGYRYADVWAGQVGAAVRIDQKPVILARISRSRSRYLVLRKCAPTGVDQVFA